MLTRENEGSKKSVRKVVQDFVHQQYHCNRGGCFDYILHTLGSRCSRGKQS